VELDETLKEKDSIARRSSFSNWNFNAEIKALQARLGEKIESGLLTRALTMNSHLEQERKKQEELGVEVNQDFVDNSELAEKGRSAIHTVLTRWLRGAFPMLPEEMIDELREYLQTEQVMADVAFHIGLRDLVLSEEYPPSASSLKMTLEAVIGALTIESHERAEQLVIDLLASQVHGKEVQEICVKSLENPMKVLAKILKNSGMEPPEPRLLFQTGPDTILASHLIGIYCDKQLIGQSYGETLDIAEEMAARDTLRNIFGTSEFSPPLPHGKHVSDVTRESENVSIGEYSVDPRNLINC